jgi:hypothetical protein
MLLWGLLSGGQQQRNSLSQRGLLALPGGYSLGYQTLEITHRRASYGLASALILRYSNGAAGTRLSIRVPVVSEGRWLTNGAPHVLILPKILETIWR